MKNPHDKNIRQNILTLQLISNTVEAENKEPLSSIGTSKFYQEAIRKCLAHMLIIELSFKFVKGKRFKKFLSVVGPRFKLPSIWILTMDCFDVYLNVR